MALADHVPPTQTFIPMLEDSITLLRELTGQVFDLLQATTGPALVAEFPARGGDLAQALAQRCQMDLAASLDAIQTLDTTLHSILARYDQVPSAGTIYDVLLLLRTSHTAPSALVNQE